MTNEETMQKLLEMRLRGMATAYHELQIDSPHGDGRS